MTPSKRPKSDAFYHTSKAFPLFVNYFEHTGHPVLVGFWSSTHAWESEALSDAEITAQCLAALEECLAPPRSKHASTGGTAAGCGGGATAAAAGLPTEPARLRDARFEIPAPIEVEITRWGSDPCALGAYTHIPVGVRARSQRPAYARTVFAQVVCPQFAWCAHSARNCTRKCMQCTDPNGVGRHADVGIHYRRAVFTFVVGVGQRLRCSGKACRQHALLCWRSNVQQVSGNGARCVHQRSARSAGSSVCACRG